MYVLICTYIYCMSILNLHVRNLHYHFNYVLFFSYFVSSPQSLAIVVVPSRCRSCQSGLYRYGLVGIDQNKQPRHSKSVLVTSMAKSSGWLGRRIGKTDGITSLPLRQSQPTRLWISICTVCIVFIIITIK